MSFSNFVKCILRPATNRPCTASNVLAQAPFEFFCNVVYRLRSTYGLLLSRLLFYYKFDTKISKLDYQILFMFSGHLTLRRPFLFFYFFKQENCSKTKNNINQSVATGTLLTPARVEMSDGRNGMVSQFSIFGPFKCHKKGTWFVIPTSKFLNVVNDSMKIKRQKKIPIPIKNKALRRHLNGYLKALVKSF